MSLRRSSLSMMPRRMEPPSTSSPLPSTIPGFASSHVRIFCCLYLVVVVVVVSLCFIVKIKKRFLRGGKKKNPALALPLDRSIWWCFGDPTHLYISAADLRFKIGVSLSLLIAHQKTIICSIYTQTKMKNSILVTGSFGNTYHVPDFPLTFQGFLSAVSHMYTLELPDVRGDVGKMNERFASRRWFAHFARERYGSSSSSSSSLDSHNHFECVTLQSYKFQN